MRPIPVLAALSAALWLSVATQAHDYELGDLRIEHPWARATIGQVKAGAAYVTLSNHGAEVDRLVAVATPAAKRAAVHANLVEDGVMKMRPVEALEVTPGEPAVLAPGGLHIMLMGLKAPLQVGETFPMSLCFERAGAIDIEVVIESPTASHGE